MDYPGVAFKQGDRGETIKLIQKKLNELGFNAGTEDGVFGFNTKQATIEFQRSKGLTKDGIIGRITWNALFSEVVAPIKPSNSYKLSTLEKAITITGRFEGNGYGNITGDFDGQGLSLGILQWNIGQGTLQPLLREMNLNYNMAARSILLDSYNAFNTMLSKTPTEQLTWAKTINNSQKVIREPWRTRLIALANSQEFRAIQLNYAKTIGDLALSICNKYNLKSERAFALAFDIGVQNGGVKAKTDLRIAYRASSDVSEKDRMALIANAVANDSNTRWIEDVRSRKLAIVNGFGTVHGSFINIDKEYGLTDNPF